MKKIIAAVVLGMFVFTGIFSFASPALAAPGGPIKGVIVKGGITTSDLGITNVGTLPTSRFYFLKEWRRGVSRVLIFGGIAKAEFELKIANETAAELLTVEKEYKEKPQLLSPEAKAIQRAIENYSKAQERLTARLAKLTGNSENPNVAKLLETVDKSTALHMAVLTEISARKEYVGHVSILKREVAPTGDDDCDGMGDDPSARVLCLVENAQAKTQDTIVAAVEKDSNIKQKAADQITRADFAIKEQGVKSAVLGGALPGGAVISARLAALLTNAKDHLDRAKKAFAEEKYGEAFALARRSSLAFAYIMWSDKTAPAPTTEVQPSFRESPSSGTRVNRESPTIPTPQPRSIPENSLKQTPSAESGTMPVPPTEPLVVCTMQYDPVCGADGNTYGNSCVADVAKVAVKYKGECPVTAQPSTTGAGTTNSDGTGTRY